MFLLVALLIIIPVVELVVLVQVAQWIGVWEALFLLLAVSLLGAWVVKLKNLEISTMPSRIGKYATFSMVLTVVMALLAASPRAPLAIEGYTVSLEDWLQRNFRREPGSKPNGFWVRADPGVLVGRWVESVGVDRVTVIALDEADRELLPSTFEQLLGLPDRLLVDLKKLGA